MPAASAAVLAAAASVPLRNGKLALKSERAGVSRQETPALPLGAQQEVRSTRVKIRDENEEILAKIEMRLRSNALA